MDVDIGDLANLEEQFYDVGYTEGFEHGRQHGLIEGRSLGKAKGFEIWEEVGFYLGFASTWKSLLQLKGEKESRALLHLNHLLDMIGKFPMVNPSANSQGNETLESGKDEVDIAQLLSNIRARYKAACSTLGARPRPTSSSGVAQAQNAPPVDETDTNIGSETNSPSVWTLTEAVKRAGPGGMTF